MSSSERLSKSGGLRLAIAVSYFDSRDRRRVAVDARFSALTLACSWSSYCCLSHLPNPVSLLNQNLSMKSLRFCERPRSALIMPQQGCPRIPEAKVEKYWASGKES